jgi:lipopolysaccharide export system permease protein
MLIELWNKTALPFASCVFILIGAPLAVTSKRSGGSLGMGVSIIIIFIYYIILSSGRALGEAQLLSPAAAAWLPIIVMAFVGMILIYMRRK